MSTAATSPASSWIRSAATTAATRTINVAGTTIRGAWCWTSRSSSQSAGAPTAATSAPIATPISSAPGCHPFPEQQHDAGDREPREQRSERDEPDHDSAESGIEFPERKPQPGLE